MSVMIGFYVDRVYRSQGGELPEDTLTADIDDGDPEMGEFTTVRAPYSFDGAPDAALYSLAEEKALAKAIGEVFDLHPGAIIRDLDLLRPIYSQFTAYGHFGRNLPDMTWERTDRAEQLAAAVRG